jgi:hypothetical protein
VGEVVVLPLSRGQRLLARCRDEERAFRLVLGSIRAGRRDKLFLDLFGFYRVRMRLLQRLAGTLLQEWEPGTATDALRAFSARDDGVHAVLRGDPASDDPGCEPAR